MTNNYEERLRIGYMVAERRKALGYSIRGLSVICGVSAQNITKIENGRYNVSIDILGKIASALGMQITLNTTDNKQDGI